MSINYKSVSVIGLGYIGLPTAAIIANRGISVIGVDNSPDVVNVLKTGKTHISEPDLDILVHAAVNYVPFFTLGRIHKQDIWEDDLTYRLKAVEKILDINLDTLTSSYREEEMSRFLSLSRIEKTLIGILQKNQSIL